MKKTFLTLLLLGFLSLAHAQEPFTQLYGSAIVQDKISLHDNRLGATNMYGFGVESFTLYYKALGTHRWYINKNADGGASSKMELNTTALTLKTLFKSTGKMSLISNSSALGDIISLYGDRLENTNMYGFGIESGGGTLYNKAVSGYNWYINKNADQGASAVLKLNSNELVMDGKIRSEEVMVEVVNAPDYVFEPGYELRTLQETKDYITKNKHLPEIPSAREMESGGVAVGDMNMKLLKKIEELTLYQIELMERLAKAEREISRLKNEN